MNRLLIILAIGIAIVALFFLNQGIKKASPTDEDLQQAQEAAQKAAPPPSAPTPTPTPIPAHVQQTLLVEETVGDPNTALHHLEVGWIYDEATLAHPEILKAALQKIRNYVQQSQGTTSAEIVDLDVPVEDRSPAARKVQFLGVLLDGKLIDKGDWKLGSSFK